jgi:hypothetical protein
MSTQQEKNLQIFKLKAHQIWSAPPIYAVGIGAPIYVRIGARIIPVLFLIIPTFSGFSDFLAFPAFWSFRL